MQPGQPLTLSLTHSAKLLPDSQPSGTMRDNTFTASEAPFADSLFRRNK